MVKMTFFFFFYKLFRFHQTFYGEDVVTSASVSPCSNDTRSHPTVNLCVALRLKPAGPCWEHHKYFVHICGTLDKNNYHSIRSKQCICWGLFSAADYYAIGVILRIYGSRTAQRDGVKTNYGIQFQGDWLDQWCAFYSLWTTTEL